MVTASPARPTERSAKGNIAGVLVAIKNFLDNRPAAFAIDAEGRLTGNAQLTGRMLVMKWIELLVLSGYLECGICFAGANYEFLTDLDYVTRGGKVAFFFC